MQIPIQMGQILNVGYSKKFNIPAKIVGIKRKSERMVQVTLRNEKNQIVKSFLCASKETDFSDCFFYENYIRPLN